ncbi:MAG: DUF3471 domain-containing protein, partial [Saprospiraceae bacterium]|nr:DUF3471 domain-containing protein [Saprospiraceae bacterium]
SAQMVMSGGVPSEENPNIYFGSYGLGWMLSSYYGHYRVEHGGNINGFSATVCFFPSDSVGVVVLVNQNASQAGAVVRNLIIDRLLGLPYRDWHSYLLERAQKQQAVAKETPEAPDLGRKTGTQLSQALSAYAGRYLHPGYGALLVELRNDSLFAHTQSLNFYLEHYHYDIFRPLAMIAGVDLESNSPIRMQFIPDLKGDIAEIRASGLEASVEPLVFKKQATEVAMAESELEKYTGAYTLSGIDCKVYLKNGALYVFVPGQPEYETRPVGNHEFKLTALDGYSVRFDVDSQGKAVAANFIQPNGTFRAVRK